MTNAVHDEQAATGPPDSLSGQGWWLWPAAIAVVVFLGGLTGTRQPFVNAEARCLEIGQTMHATGDYLVPRLKGAPHLTKPPLFHWLGCFVSTVRGRADLLSIRLVSALSALATVFGIGWLGCRFRGRRAACLAMLLTITCLPLVHHAHRGTFDALLTACVVLSIACLAEACRPGARRRWWVAAALLLAAGFMTKGFLAWLLPAFALIPVWWRQADWRPRLSTGVAAIFALATLSLAWYVYLIVAVPGAREILFSVVTVNFGQRSATYGMAFHQEPVYFYLVRLPGMLLPWTLLAVPCVRDLWRRRRIWKTVELMGVGWALAGVLLLSLIPAKAVRYMVPILPAWALLTACWLDRALDATTEEPWLRCNNTAIVVAMALAAPALGLWLAIRIGEPIIGCVAACLAAWGLAAMLHVLSRRRRYVLMVLATVVCCATATVFVYTRWLPVHVRIHKDKGSAAARAYRQRQQALRDWGRGLFGRAGQTAPPSATAPVQE